MFDGFQIVWKVFFRQEEIALTRLQSEAVVHHDIFDDDRALEFAFVDQLGLEHLIQLFAAVQIHDSFMTVRAQYIERVDVMPAFQVMKNEYVVAVIRDQ